LVKLFFCFFQTLARFGHPKVENLVQDKVFFQIKITEMRIFYFFFVFQIPQVYEYYKSAKISMPSINPMTSAGLTLGHGPRAPKNKSKMRGPKYTDVNFIQKKGARNLQTHISSKRRGLRFLKIDKFLKWFKTKSKRKGPQT
jgi:hypothetical protein